MNAKAGGVRVTSCGVVEYVPAMTNPSTPSDRRSRHTADDDGPDFWIALIAGESVWADVDESITALDRGASSSFELLALVWSGLMLWLGLLLDDGVGPEPAIVGTVALSVLAARPLLMLLGFRRHTPLWWSFSIRVIVVIAIGVAGLLTGPTLGFLVALTMAAALGVEAALCAWVLGVAIEPTGWCWGFVRSPLHLGVIGAAVGSALNIGTSESVQAAALVYVMFVASVLGGILCAAILERLRREADEEGERRLSDAIGAEHRQAAHWLHDDVSSELKLVQLRLRGSGLTAEEVAQQLFDLDHSLRLRQLDELFASGSVNLAEILQPFVRRAQSQGLEITDVPTFDDASTTVDTQAGRRFARAVSIVTGNAIAAGATRLAISVASDDDYITLVVTDDAGGFQLDDVPAGRGLWQLRQDLDGGDIDVDSNDTGSTVSVRIGRKVGARGQAAAR